MAKVRLRRKGDAGKHIDGIRRALAGPDFVKVGLPSGAAGKDLVAIAMFNEFGTRTAPERPFMRNALRGNRGHYIDAMSAGAGRIMRLETTKVMVLRQLGVKASGDIQREMPGTPPPNKPSTIERKGSSTTLVDTGRLRQSVTWKLGE